MLCVYALSAGGIKGKGKKNGVSLGGGSSGGSGHGGGKLKKNSQFKSLKKQQYVAPCIDSRICYAYCVDLRWKS